MKRGRRACANLKFEFVQKTRYTPFSVTLHNDVTRKSMLGPYSPHIELVVRKEDSTSNRRLSSLNFNLSLSLSLSLSSFSFGGRAHGEKKNKKIMRSTA